MDTTQIKFQNQLELYSRYLSQHLSSTNKIKWGSFYTPEKIVDVVHKLIERYKSYPQAVIFDNAAGAGAFFQMKKSFAKRLKLILLPESF